MAGKEACCEEVARARRIHDLLDRFGFDCHTFAIGDADGALSAARCDEDGDLVRQRGAPM